MAAYDAATVTIDTDEMTYIDKEGNSYVITNGQTFTLALAAGGAGTQYTVTAGEMTCEQIIGGTSGGDTYRLGIEFDPTFTMFTAAADATQITYPNVGTMTFIEPKSGEKAIWDIRSLTIDDIDEPTEITEMVMERRDNPQFTISLATITVAQ